MLWIPAKFVDCGVVQALGPLPQRALQPNLTNLLNSVCYSGRFLSLFTSSMRVRGGQRPELRRAATRKQCSLSSTSSG